MIDVKNIRRAARLKAALDAGVLAGAGVFVFGLYLVWHPLAPLVGGLLLAAGCAFAGYDHLRKRGN